MTSLRVFFVGGLLSYRALFGWLSPWILIPTFVIAPISQILLFVYIGRAAGIRTDEFYVVGNAMQYAAIPCVFAMTNTIAGERYQNTLGAVLVTPAKRIPLFLGRSLPVILNGFLVAAFAFAAGGAILRIDVPASAIPAIALVLLVSAAVDDGPRPVDGRDRPPGTGHGDALEHRLRDPARLHRGERRALRPARLDVHARPGPSTHARDRGGAEARRRRIVRPRRRACRRRGPGRRALRARRVRADPPARADEPDPRDPGARMRTVRLLASRPPFPRQEPDAVGVLPAHVDLHAAAGRDGRLLHVPSGRPARDAVLRVARRLRSTGSGPRRCSARGAQSSGSAGRARSRCWSRRRHRSSSCCCR